MSLLYSISSPFESVLSECKEEEESCRNELDLVSSQQELELSQKASFFEIELSTYEILKRIRQSHSLVWIGRWRSESGNGGGSFIPSKRRRRAHMRVRSLLCQMQDES